MSPRLRQLMGWGRQTLLTVGAVLGTLCLLSAAASALFGVRPLVFESGSMSPTITTGALAISHDVDASDLRVGDVVSVPTGSGQRVTHRIVTVTLRADVAALALRGDANRVSDARTYEVSHADRVLFHVPYLGYAISWLVGPIGLFLLGLYTAFLLSIVLRRDAPRSEAPDAPKSDDTEPRPPPISRVNGGARKAQKRRSVESRSLVRTLSVLAALGLLTAGVFPFRTVPTLAAWSDATNVTGASITARLPTPGAFSCGPSGRATVFAWTLVEGAHYVLHYGQNGGTVEPLALGTTSFTTGNNSTGEGWIVAFRTFNGQEWTSLESAHFTYNRGVCTLV